MGRTIFASDLDNTLLFSHKHALDDDLCVEYLDGKPQGYLPPGAPACLEALMARALFIPVTSRSVEQYRRICFPRRCRPQYAVTTNGGLLLADGEIDPDWRRDSLRAIRPWRAALEEMLAALEERCPAGRFRLVDGMFAFAACGDPLEARALQARLAGDTGLDVAVSGRKVYCFPPPLNKGAAVRRLRQRFGAERVICAGDSPIDRPMLEQADVAIVPREDLAAGLPRRRRLLCGPEERFSEFVLRQAAAQVEARTPEGKEP